MAGGGDRPEISIANESISVAWNAQNRSEIDVQPLTEDDRTLRTFSLQVYRRASGGNSEIVGLATPTGIQTMMLYGADASGNEDQLRTNSDQQLQVQVVGADAGGANDPLLTDTRKILWTHPFEDWQDVDPVEIPSSEGDLWDPGGTSAEVYRVWFYIVNNDAGGASVTVSVGLDLASGETLAAPEYWLFNRVIPYPGSSGWQGGERGFVMHGDDQIRGVASAANDASIHFAVLRTDGAS